MIELLKKLNEKGNFHLSLKAILVTNNQFLLPLKLSLDNKGYKTRIIHDERIYSDLLEAYENKIDYIIINENINFINPIYILMDKYLNVVKPCSTIIYALHDNNQINILLKNCNEKKAIAIKAKKIHSDKDLKVRDLNNLIEELNNHID